MRSERELILELFFGRPNLQGKRPRIYPTGEAERPARKALARRLREGKLELDLAEVLADLIDPDADLKTQPLRILKFQFRSRKRQQDFFRDMLLVRDVYELVSHPENQKLEDAINEVAERHKLSSDRLTKIWKNFWRRFKKGSPLAKGVARGRLKKNKRSVPPAICG
jgi:hypothetical protein